jgi:hypothetical protein
VNARRDDQEMYKHLFRDKESAKIDILLILSNLSTSWMFSKGIKELGNLKRWKKGICIIK